MTDENTSTSISENKAKTTVEDAVIVDTPATHSTKPAKTGFLWFFTLVNLVCLLALAGGAYWYWMQTQTAQGERQTDLALVESRLDGLRRAQEQTQNTVSANQNTRAEAMESLLAQISENKKINQALQNQLAEVSGRRPSDWLLAEADYLVTMAGRKLYLEKDLRTSITLLQEADSRLQDLNDPSLLPIRALIASDVQNLQQVNPVSTTSLALAITGLLPQVAQLPLDSLKLPEPEAEENIEVSGELSEWRQNLSAVWQSIKKDFITVTPINKPLEPYLAERQQWLIEQQLKHALTQAKSAALDEQYTLYQSSLQEALGLTIEHYKLDEVSVDQFIKALQQLQNSNFERNFPDKLNAQEALRDAIERRLMRQFNNRDDVL